MTNFLLLCHNILWGIPGLTIIIGVGLYIGFRTRFVQLRFFPKAIKELVVSLRRDCAPGSISPFQALCTALAATVGTGNLVGVAGAICLGGPGAIFWMWICGVMGMGLKFAETVLAIRFRSVHGGARVGGPMYIIQNGMGSQWMPIAYAYALFGLIASFGVGNATQINAVIGAVRSAAEFFGVVSSPRRELGIGILLAAAVGAVLLGGAKRIGQTAEKLIPLASMAYIFLCLWVLFRKRDALLDAFQLIIKGAFSPEAVTGGIIGSSFTSLRVGCARGIFTNEAGMGTASMAHAGANVQHPAQQGLLGIVEVFIDTIVICTLTALVILASGIHIPYGTDAGGTLTSQAFAAVCGNWTGIFLASALSCFAFATVLGWGLYGIRCAQFLFRRDVALPFALCQTCCVVLAALLPTETLWKFAEVVNGAMAIPNLTALAFLSPELCRLITEYERFSG